MSRESWKVFVACALGAGIGSLVALELNQWLWWFGLIAGGLVGYFSYEWRAVVQAIPAAWKVVVSPSLSLRRFGWTMALWLCVSFHMTLLFFALGLVGGFGKGMGQMQIVGAILVSGIAGMVGSLWLLASVLAGEQRSRTDEGKLVHMRQLACVTFPPILYGWHLPRGIIWFVRATSKFIARFCWQVFIRIHSEMRLLCMADAALGAAVGYFIGSAIIGALAGGVFGLINYAVITKRILEPRGLLPAR